MELSKVRTAEEIIARFKDGQIIAIGGQTNQYMPDRLIDCVLESGARHLTIYSIDSSDPGHGVSLLVEAGRVDAMITTHVGTNPLTNAKIQSGALKAEFNPMGTFIERIRCGGAGLGGVLTKTGLGTVVEEGKQIIEVNGESYLLETALRADIALTRCRRADPWQPGLQRQQRPRLPPGDRHLWRAVHRGVRPLLRPGGARPRQDQGARHVRGHDSGVRRRDNGQQKLYRQAAAAYFRPGDVVNLGIGIPSLCGSYAVDGVLFQSENGFIGIGPTVQEGLMKNERFVNAGGVPFVPVPGSSAFDVAMSFNVIRCGRLAATVLGGLQVSAQGDLANWATPGRAFGMGGAMDLCNGARKVIVAMELVAKDGSPKVVSRCTLPLTAVKCVNHIVTDRCVIDVTEEGLVLSEIRKGHTVEEIQAAVEPVLLVSPDLKEMEED